MKNRLKYIVLAGLFSAFLASCKTEYLDPIPAIDISDLTAFDTRDRIIGQVNGLYTAVKDGEYLGGRFQVYNDIRGDDFLNLQSNGVTGLETWNHRLSPSSGEVTNLWGQVYNAINRFNVFIDGMNANRERILGTNMLSEDEFNQFIGEAFALRGMAYFHLSMLYARPYNQNPNAPGLVLRLTGQRDDTGNDMARATVAETFRQIIADLDTAKLLLPPSHGEVTANDALNVTRMQRNTVIALLTRVHLHRSDYAAVLAEGNLIVPASAPFVNAGGGVQYALASTFESIFRPPYTTSESIFSIPMTPNELPGTQNQLGHYFSAPPAGAVEYSINPDSPIWTNTTDFPATDSRRLLTETHEGHIFLDKYPTMPHTDWAPVIRYAEVLLNVAEAEARVAESVTPRAVALLNAVHLRSNVGGTPMVPADFANVDAFVNRIMLERNMEFLGEGIRNMDIMRKRAPLGAIGRTIVGVDTTWVVAPVLYTSIAYVWPIPQSEINVNQLIEQNE